MPEQFYDSTTYQARDSIGYLVRRLHSTLSSRIEASFASHDFSLMQWILLMHLRDGLVRTAADIARELQHDSGALTRVLDQLESRGLIVRRRSSTDRRVVELDLTAQGRKVIAELLPTVVREINAALAPLSRAEFDQFRRLLLKVVKHLQPPIPAPTPAARKPAARPAGARRAMARPAPRGGSR